MMTQSIQEKFDKILQLSEEKQNILAPYLQKHLNELLQQAEKARRIEEGNYTINDLNEETQQSIKNIEEKQNLTVCQNQDELDQQLEKIAKNVHIFDFTIDRNPARVWKNTIR